MEVLSFIKNFAYKERTFTVKIQTFNSDPSENECKTFVVITDIIRSYMDEQFMFLKKNSVSQGFFYQLSSLEENMISQRIIKRSEEYISNVLKIFESYLC
jgi:hypothetical protein